MVEETRPVIFVVQFINQPREEFAMRFVPQLGRIHALANGVMTHIMRTGFDIETLQEALTRHDRSAIIVSVCNAATMRSCIILISAFPSGRAPALKWAFALGHQPGFIFTQTHLDIVCLESIHQVFLNLPERGHIALAWLQKQQHQEHYASQQ